MLLKSINRSRKYIFVFMSQFQNITLVILQVCITLKLINFPSDVFNGRRTSALLEVKKVC